MSIEFLLAILGPGMLGGAGAYLLWTRVDPAARAARKARTKSEEPVIASPKAGAATATQPAAAQGAAAPAVTGPPAAGEPGAAQEPATDAPIEQEPKTEIGALRNDVAELASTLLTMHENISESSPNSAEAERFGNELADKISAMADYVESALKPERLSELFQALMPEPPDTATPTADPSEALEALSGRIEQFGTAITSTLGGLPDETRAALAEVRSAPPDFAPVLDRLDALMQRVTALSPTDPTEQLKAISARLETLDEPPDLSALDARLEAIETRLDSPPPETSQDTDPAIADGLSALNARLDTLDTKLAETARPDWVDAQTEALNTLSETLVHEVTAVSSALDALSQHLSAAPTGAVVGGEVSTPDGMGAQIDAVLAQTSALPQMRERLALMGTALARLGGRRSESDALATRFSALQAALTEDIRDAVMQAMQNAPQSQAGAEEQDDAELETLLEEIATDPDLPSEPDPLAQSDS